MDDRPQDECQPNKTTNWKGDPPVEGELGLLKSQTGGRTHDIGPKKPETD